MKLYADFQRFNFFRRPDWRWERVLRMVDRHPTPGRASRRDDDFVRRARTFVLRWRSRNTEEEREELFWEEPGLYYAYELFERQTAQPEGALFLQARLLARQTFEQIAELLSTVPDTVRWYEALFFNVADRLQNRDWITKHVLLPALLRQTTLTGQSNSPFMDSVAARPFLDGSLKLFAYFGGPHVADVMITGFQSGKPPASADGLAEWFDGHWSMTVRRRSTQAALQFEINKFNVTELLTVHARLIELDRSEQNREQQRTAAEKHIQAMIDQIAWVVGQDGQAVLDRASDGASELRDDEMGRDAPRRVWPAKLPAPRKDKMKIGLREEEEF